MIVKFNYSYLKILYKKFSKELNTGSLIDKKVRYAVIKELGIVQGMSINNKNTLKRSYRVHLERSLKKEIPNFIYAEYNKERQNKSNKELRAISESVKIFLKEKIAEERAKKNDSIINNKRQS